MEDISKDLKQTYSAFCPYVFGVTPPDVSSAHTAQTEEYIMNSQTLEVPTARPMKWTFTQMAALIFMFAGAAMLVGGGVTWSLVSSKLAAERITVAEDAAHFAGKPVKGPLTAYFQADIINHHSLKATNGKTYAELDREDPLRTVAMNGSFLRASLFTSVVSFGVAFLAMGLGVLFFLLGLVLRKRE